MGLYLRKLIICRVLEVCQAPGTVLGTNIISLNPDLMRYYLWYDGLQFKET